MKKTRRGFSEEVKVKAVDDYVSGRRRADDVANELGIGQGLLYRWRVQLAEKAKGARVEGTSSFRPALNSWTLLP